MTLNADVISLGGIAGEWFEVKSELVAGVELVIERVHVTSLSEKQIVDLHVRLSAEGTVCLDEVGVIVIEGDVGRSIDVGGSIDVDADGRIMVDAGGRSCSHCDRLTNPKHIYFLLAF